MELKPVFLIHDKDLRVTESDLPRKSPEQALSYEEQPYEGEGRGRVAMGDSLPLPAGEPPPSLQQEW